MDGDEPESTGSEQHLVRDLSDELRRLVRDESERLRRELREKVRASLLAVVCLFTAAVLGFFFVACVIATIILIFTASGSWLPTICTAAVLFGLIAALGGVAVLVLRMVSPLAPAYTVESVREDIDAVRKGLSS